MDSIMFFYVFIYKSVLITLICAFFFVVFLVLKILLWIFKRSKCIFVLKEVFSHALFFNIPFRYL